MADAPAYMPTPLDDYLFDLRGYLVLEQAIDPDHLGALNACIDRIPPLESNQWYGYVHRQRQDEEDHASKFGINLQQIYEGGEPFERLIDHPRWIELVKRYVGGEGTFDVYQGPVFIDEAFVNLRGPGQAINLHSGGHDGVKRTQYRYYNGRFQCCQINILMALTDMNPGDGATVVIPGSHKSNLPHPHYATQQWGKQSADNIEGAIEVNLKAGDVLLFVDALAHGSAERSNPGQRRICVYRYGPAWGNYRFGYYPSETLLARLTPLRRKIIRPLEPIPRPEEAVVKG